MRHRQRIDQSRSGTWHSAFPYTTMPKKAKSTGRFFCTVCDKNYQHPSIVSRHENGQTGADLVASALADGRLDQENIRPRKRQRQMMDTSSEAPEHAPRVKELLPPPNSIFPNGPDQAEEPDLDALSAPSGVLANAANARTQTRLGTVWIEEVLDEGEAAGGGVDDDNASVFDSNNGGEDDPDAVWDEGEDDEEDLNSWVQDMEDELRREIEQFGS